MWVWRGIVVAIIGSAFYLLAVAPLAIVAGLWGWELAIIALPAALVWGMVVDKLAGLYFGKTHWWR